MNSIRLTAFFRSRQLYRSPERLLAIIFLLLLLLLFLVLTPLLAKTVKLAEMGDPYYLLRGAALPVGSIHSYSYGYVWHFKTVQ